MFCVKMVSKTVPKVGSPTRRATNAETDTQNQEVTDYETALDRAGYGCFSRSALCACACAFFSTGVENSIMSFALPAARCDLNLTTYNYGLINMAFMTGGAASAFFWGIVGDVIGRRNTLALTLLVNAVVTLAESFIIDYRVLMAARCINGFLIGGPSTLTFPYLSDLVGKKSRQFYLNIVGMCFVGAWLIVPAFAWMVIPVKISYESVLPIYSWRLYLALCSVPSFAAGFMVFLLPESPRLLMDTDRNEDAVKILKYIHKVNCGSSEEFQVKKLIQENVFVSKTMSEEQSRTKVLFIGVLNDLKTLVSKDYAVKSTFIMFAFFVNMAAGFGLNFWIPEILLRMTSRDCGHTVVIEQAKLTINRTLVMNDITRPLFTANYLENNSSFVETIDVITDCSSEIGDEVFTWNLIVGACCLIGNIICAILIERGGASGVRHAANACAFVCALACAALGATACACTEANKLAVASAAMLNAASLNGNVLLIRLLLFALPPKLSGMGVCWGAWWGRAGGVASNFAVGSLLDVFCPAPFITVAALLIISMGAIMGIKLYIPEELQETQAKTEINQEKPTNIDRYISTHM